MRKDGNRGFPKGAGIIPHLNGQAALDGPSTGGN